MVVVKETHEGNLKWDIEKYGRLGFISRESNLN
jgi:hypothetical protein